MRFINEIRGHTLGKINLLIILRKRNPLINKKLQSLMDDLLIIVRFHEEQKTNIR